MEHPKPNSAQIQEIKNIRMKTGMGLRESYDAFFKYGSEEAALKALNTYEKRDSFEDQVQSARTKASWYDTLRDSGQFVVCTGGVGWRDRRVNEEKATAEALDQAMLKWHQSVTK